MSCGNKRSCFIRSLVCSFHKKYKPTNEIVTLLAKTENVKSVMLQLDMSNFLKIRARHGTGTADLLDGPSIKPHSFLGPALSPAVYPFSIRPLMLGPA